MDMKNIEKILTHYLICALWTEELDDRTLEEISAESKAKAKEEIESFVHKAGNLLDGITDEMIGHDFWLTRNGHGAGFWDRGLGETGDKLTKICEKFGVSNVFGEDADEIVIE